MSRRVLFSVTLITFGLLTACASTTIQSIHSVPDFRSSAIHHVLVIGMIQNQSMRKTLEDEFVRQWSRRGVRAESSLVVLPLSTTLDKAGVEPFAKAQGFDAVLVTRLKEKKTIAPGEPAVSTIEPPPSQKDTKDEVWQVLLAPPVSTSPFDLDTVETNLYDVATETLVWSGWSETEVMGKIPKLIAPFVKLILKRLYETPGH